MPLSLWDEPELQDHLKLPCDLPSCFTPDPSHPPAGISGPQHTVLVPDFKFILVPTRVRVTGPTFLPIMASVCLL